MEVQQRIEGGNEMSDLRRQLENLVDDVDEAMRTRDRLLAARLIAHEQISGASEELVLVVFRELCALRNVWTDDGPGDAETLH
jgi:hypothetical protein